MSSDKLRLYPRGFVGEQDDLVLFEKPSAHQDILKQLQFTPLIFDPPKNYIQPSLSVNRIYAAYTNRSRDINDMTFKREVLTVAFKLFGQGLFPLWLMANCNNKFASENHMSFLDEICYFLIHGDHKVDLNVWARLLSSTEEPTDKKGLPKHAQMLFHSKEISEDQWSHALTDIDGKLILSVSHVLQRWCSHPGGIDDLVKTLFVLFGSLN